MNTLSQVKGTKPAQHTTRATATIITSPLGPITKAGNSHARRLLVEAAWHHRPVYRPSMALRGRWELATPAARRRGDADTRRLHQRWTVFTDRKKRHTVADAAIARELAGWCWSLATLDDPTPCM